MTSELETVVGRLLVVGGRAVSAPPPGALVTPPPRRAARGREQDTIFVLITPAGSEQAQAAFYEELARRITELYFASAGSVTSAWREAITGLNAYLLSAANPGHYQANLIGLVLRGHDCYVARAGACLSLICQNDALLSEPGDLRDEYALNGLPLGYSPAPDIKFAHYVAAPDQVLVLSDAGFAAAPRDSLQAAVGTSDIPATLDALKPLAAARTQALIIRFTLAGTPAPPAPVLSPANTATGPLSRPVAPVGVASAAPASAPVIATVPPPIQIVTAPPPTSLSDPVMAAAPPVVWNADGSPLPPPDPAPRPRPLRPAVRVNVRGIAIRIVRFPLQVVAFILTGIARLLNAILDRLLPEPEDGRAHIPATMAAGVAVLLPVLVVFVMVGLRLSQVDQTNFEKLVSQVQDQANQAAVAAAKADATTAKKLWQAVLQSAINAEQQRPGGDPTLEKIQAQAQSILDGYEHVTRRTATPLRTFGLNAQLGPVLVQGGADVYTLDLKNSAIYRDTLRAPSPDVIGTRSTQPIVENGSAVSGLSVKQLVAMIWMDEGGIRTSHALVALDTQGFLVTYSPTFAPALSQPLPGAEGFKTPAAIRTWQDRLYILDPGANQIWRYLPSGTTYPNPPEQYFTVDYQRNLTKAIDFAIDEKGNVYVLFADGTIKEFNGGAEQPFALTGVPDTKLKSGGALYLDSSSPLSALYVTDPVDQSVYEFTLAGIFQARYRASEPLAFAHLSGVFAQGNNVYVTSGNTLYYFNTTANFAPGQ
ncbi:MAG: NHL repeat-containing protein [Aggregatilineales bacterium]